MLGISVNIDIKDTHYPIAFDGVNKCVHCGGIGTLTLVDAFGKEVRQVVHALDHYKCRQCGRVFGIKWMTDAVGEYYPIAVDPSIKNHFAEFVTKALGTK